MMATADGIAARARALAIKPRTLRRPLCALMLACAALLGACGGGDAAQTDDAACTRFSAVDVPGAGIVASVTVRNADSSPRLITITGSVVFSAAASGSAGGHSTVLVTDGQSPVYVGTIKSSGTTFGRLPFSVDVVLPAGSGAVWQIAHAPLPAPYGWASMRFSGAEMCVN